MMLGSNTIRQTHPMGVPMNSGIGGQISQYANLSLPMGVSSGYDVSNMPQPPARHSVQQPSMISHSMGHGESVFGKGYALNSVAPVSHQL